MMRGLARLAAVLMEAPAPSWEVAIARFEAADRVARPSPTTSPARTASTAPSAELTR